MKRACGVSAVLLLVLLSAFAAHRAEAQHQPTSRKHEPRTIRQPAAGSGGVHTHRQDPQVVQDYGPVEGHHHHDGAAHVLTTTNTLQGVHAPGTVLRKQQEEQHQARHVQHHDAAGAPHSSSISSSIPHQHEAAGKEDAKGVKASGGDSVNRGKVPVVTILVMTTFMALMSGFGAMPFFFVAKLKHSWAGLANAVACGVMLAASFDLLHEGAPYSPALTIGGMVLGALFIR